MKLETLEQGNYYHIFNRGINSETIFKNEGNKTYFLGLMKKYLEGNTSILSYCLMDNHFHFLLKINSDGKIASQSISNLFNAYAKAFNKQQNRTGSLFEKHFRRKKITDENYLKNLILYIHKNPENHNVVKYFKDYKFTSYQSYFLNNPSLITNEKPYVLELFDDLDNFEYVHTLDLQGFENLAGLETVTSRNKVITPIRKRALTCEISKTL